MRNKQNFKKFAILNLKKTGLQSQKIQPLLLQDEYILHNPTESFINFDLS